MRDSKAQSVHEEGNAENPRAYAICPDCAALGRCLLGIPSTFKPGAGCGATGIGKTAVYAALKEKDKNGNLAVESYKLSGRIVSGTSWCQFVRSRRVDADKHQPARKTRKPSPGQGKAKQPVPARNGTVPVPPDLTDPAPTSRKTCAVDQAQPPTPPPPPPPTAPDQASADQPEAGS